MSERQILREIASGIVELAYDHAQIARILLGDPARAADPALTATVEPMLARAIRVVEGILREAAYAGSLTVRDVPSAARAILGMVYGLLVYPGGPDRKTAQATLQTLLENGLLAR